MAGFLDYLSAQGLMPLGACLLWRPELLAARTAVDITLALMPLTAAWLIWQALARRSGAEYREAAVAFAFILAALGLARLVALPALWLQLHYLVSLALVACALASVLAVQRIRRVLPRLLAMPSQAALAAKTAQLEAEVARRTAAEAAAREAHLALEREHQELERRVFERTADLSAANVELERFAYVASHDLRAPLRALMTIPDWLRETLAANYGRVLPQLDEDLREMEVQSARMDRLLTDLLTYARIGRSGEHWQVVEPATLIREAMALAGLPEGFEVELREPLPRLRVIPAEFALVMRNLISNAVKHHDRERGRIVVSGRRAGAVSILEIRDDGPGIPRKYAEKIFEMFSTLRPRDEVEGSGMGLAMVKKIMEQAGGHVRLGGSGDGRGAAFELGFPAVDPEPATASDQPVMEERDVQDPAGGGQPLLRPRFQP